MAAVRSVAMLARLLLVAVAVMIAGCANTIRVTQQEIQQQIDARLPMGTPAGSPITLSLHSLQCDLLPGDASVGNNNVALDAQVRFSVLGFLQMDSRAALQGRLTYRPERSAFFIEQPQLTTLEVSQLPPQQQQRLMTSLQQLIASILATTPVYTLQDARARDHIDRVEVKDNVMLVHLKP